MKLIVTLLFALLVGALGYNWDSERSLCAKEQKLDKALIEEIDNPWEALTAEDNEVLNNYLACKWKKQGILKSNGEINWDKIDAIMDEIHKNNSEEVISSMVVGRIMRNAIEHCRTKNIRGNSPGQTAAKLQNCVGEEVRKTIKNAI